MTLIDIILLAVALSMDAFAVAVCKGLSMKRAALGSCAVVGLWFGGFQALMPALGYLVGSLFAKYIDAYVPWIAFVLLLLIGANMIREALGGCDEDEGDADLSPLKMLPLAVATSIDALATGVTFVMVEPRYMVWIGVALIGLITFGLSALGVRIGNVFGTRYKKTAEVVGGVILILLGTKILLSGLGVVNF